MHSPAKTNRIIIPKRVLLNFLCYAISIDGLIGLGILGGTALVMGGAAALVGMVFASRK